MTRFVIFVIVACSFLVSAQAPVATGAITGSVKTASDAPLSGVTVTASSAGATVAVVTNRQGTFTLPNLAPGRYVLRATLPAFREDVREITVGTGQSVQADVILQIGPIDVITQPQESPLPPFWRQSPYTIAADSQTVQGDSVRYRGNVRITTDSMELTVNELDFNTRTLEGKARGEMSLRVLPIGPRPVPLSHR